MSYHGMGNILVGPDEDQVRSLDADIAHLNTDISNHAAPPMFTPGSVAFSTDFLNWNTFKLSQWTPFVTSWAQWKNDHVSALARMTNTAGAEFESFSTKYNEFLRRFNTDFSGGSTAGQNASTGSLNPLKLIPWGSVIIIGGLLVGGYMLLTVESKKSIVRIGQK